LFTGCARTLYSCIKTLISISQRKTQRERMKLQTLNVLDPHYRRPL
jgi:hypothetical protein